MKPYTISAEKVLQEQNSNSVSGLTSQEVGKRVAKYGSNSLPDATGKSILHILWSQINNALTYILLIATIFSILADHHIDAVIVALLILINIIIGFYHEYSAEKRVKSLKDFIQYKCRVLRDGELLTLNVIELVPGDIVILEDGQSVPADIRIIKATELTAIESSLTGESAPVMKKDTTLVDETALGDRSNMLYMGTHITSGTCTGVVVATGLSTELGHIAAQLGNIKEGKSLFYKRTERLLRQMVIISAITTVLTIVLLIIKKDPLEDILQFSFAAIISGIPEGLPSVLTVLLSIASVRMSRKNALLRNMPTIETLSTVTTIITDKTGTLTQNVMSIGELMLRDGSILKVSGEGWSDSGEITFENKSIDIRDNFDLYNVLEYLALMSEGDAVKKDEKYELSGYPTEIARYLLAKKAGITKAVVMDKYEIVKTSPYNQETKYKTMVIKNLKNGDQTLLVLGGAENVLAKSKPDKQLDTYVENSAAQGYRMQVISYKNVSETGIEKTVISDMTPLAVFKISDPIRVNVPEAVTATKRAGIRVIMATGDHIATAFAIAREAGIIPKEAGFEKIGEYAISQKDIDLLSETEFASKVETINIFARVTPATKLRIAEALHKKGEIIAMTGDGVNDAPVLKKADIGIAMGMMGTDVAKEASDLILLDDSFATIVDAIKEGRTVFKNIRQTSLYLITTNLAEDIMILLSIIVGLPLPLLPIQILWLNLVTDGLSDIALATEKSHNSVLMEKPRSKKDGIISQKDFIFITVIALIMVLVAGLTFVLCLSGGIEKARTMTFAVMVMAQLFNVINMRSLDTPLFKVGYFTNRAINISLLISVLLLLGAIYIPMLRDIFYFDILTVYELIFVLGISSVVLILGEIYKVVRMKNQVAI
jgi:Ca2+-transporting ATPase